MRPSWDEIRERIEAAKVESKNDLRSNIGGFGRESRGILEADFDDFLVTSIFNDADTDPNPMVTDGYWCTGIHLTCKKCNHVWHIAHDENFSSFPKLENDWKNFMVNILQNMCAWIPGFTSRSPLIIFY